MRGDGVDQFGFGVIVDEEVEQAGGKELRALRLVKDDVDDIVAGEVPGLAQERFAATVVATPDEDGLSGHSIDGPTRPGASGFADVVFAIVVDPQREQLHQFARVVFVGVSGVAAGVI